MVFEHRNGDIASYGDFLRLGRSGSEPHPCMRSMSMSVKPGKEVITEPSYVKAGILNLLGDFDRICRIKPSSSGTYVIAYFEFQSLHTASSYRIFDHSFSGLHDHFHRCSMLTRLIWNINQLGSDHFGEDYL